MYVCVCECVCVYVCTYIHTYIHTYMHIEREKQQQKMSGVSVCIYIYRCIGTHQTWNACNGRPGQECPVTGSKVRKSSSQPDDEISKFRNCVALVTSGRFHAFYLPTTYLTFSGPKSWTCLKPEV